MVQGHPGVKKLECTDSFQNGLKFFMLFDSNVKYR